MFLIYVCLLAFISSGFSLPEGLPWDDNSITRLSARGNDYGGSVGFKQANIKDYPFLVSISSERDLIPVGAGAILNNRWIVATATFSIFSVPQLSVFVGTNIAGRSGQRYNVTKMLVHEKFNKDYLVWYNIALFKTEKPITFSDKVKPAKLAKSVPKVGTNCTVIGYGFIENTPYCGYDLGAATVKIEPRGTCERTYGALKTAFCAGSKDVELCVGDISDLLVYKNTLVGFFIQGDFCQAKHTAQIYTKVPLFKKWIWNTIKHNSNEDEMEGLSEDQFIDDEIQV